MTVDKSLKTEFMVDNKKFNNTDEVKGDMIKTGKEALDDLRKVSDKDKSKNNLKIMHCNARSLRNKID